MDDPIGLKLLAVAKAQLGYSAKADGFTKFGAWYDKNVGHDSYYQTAPWCDMFLAWAADQVGLKDSVGEFAATIDHAKWFQQQHAFGHTPEPGAIVFFSWTGSNTVDDISHVGLVESVSGSTLHTIEANTSGGSLIRRQRDVSNVVGYGYPSKVQVASAYVPRHSGPPAHVTDIGDGPVATSDLTLSLPHRVTPAPHDALNIPHPDAIMGGLLAVVLFGTVGLAVAKSKVAAIPMPSAPSVKLRKQGKHHRTGTPVALPADVTPADLVAAEDSTILMPALSLAAAQHAEDQEFWGRISHLEGDEELSFWDSLHSSISRSQGYGVNESETPVPAATGH
jgi:surface antigen